VPASHVRGRPKRRDDGPRFLSYHDGSTRLGAITDLAGVCTAFDVEGKRLGEFKTRGEACRAIAEAARG
jgi:hypothetical protein